MTQIHHCWSSTPSHHGPCRIIPLNHTFFVHLCFLRSQGRTQSIFIYQSISLSEYQYRAVPCPVLFVTNMTIRESVFESRPGPGPGFHCNFSFQFSVVKLSLSFSGSISSIIISHSSHIFLHDSLSISLLPTD